MAGERVKALSFSGLCQSAFGPAGAWAVSVIVLVNSLGSMISYLIIVGGTLPKIFHAYTGVALLADRQFVIGVSSVLFILPLLLYRDLSKLSKVRSLIAINLLT